jgi:methyl-accepting chemotaxis protein
LRPGPRLRDDRATLPNFAESPGVRAAGPAVASAAVVLAAVWLAGGLLVAGAARAAAASWIPVVFHLAALVAAGAFVRLAIARRATAAGRDDGARLEAIFEDIRANDLVRAADAGAALPAPVATPVRDAAARLAARIAVLQTSSLSVAGAADAIESRLAGLAAGATQQAAAAAEVTSAMEELARTAAQISEHAEKQSELAMRAESDGASGVDAVEAALAGLGAVEARIRETVERADSLGERSREIFRVLDVILEIARETHVLAINAALEAESAGARGRRFAVVAGEVRRLSERVSDSVATVRGRIEGFAAAIRATVVAADEGRGEVADVLARAGEAHQAFERLRSALSQSSEAARQISGVTRQQSAATEEVVSTLRELRQVVERMSRDLDKLGTTARRLHRVGLNLQVGAQAYRLDSPRSIRQLTHVWAERLAAASDPKTELAVLLAAAPFVEAAYVADPRGRLIAIQTRVESDRALGTDELAALDLSDRPWLREALATPYAVLEPPHRSLLTGGLCMTAALARRDANGAPVAIVGIDVSVHDWTRIRA